MLTQPNINSALIVLLIIGIFFILWRTKIITSMLGVLWGPDSKEWKAKLERANSHLDKCVEVEGKILSELCLYKIEEKILNSGAWLWDMTKEPDEVRYTDNFAHIFDVVAGQVMTAKSLLDIVHIDDRERVNEIIKTAFEKGEDYELEYRIVRRNDRHDLIRCFGKMIKNNNGIAIQINGAIILLKTDVD